MTATCQYCGDLLTFTPGRGWHHSEGGSVAQRCEDCGWQGAPYPIARVCPSCGSRGRYDDRQMRTLGLRDDHVAAPVYSEAARR